MSKKQDIVLSELGIDGWLEAFRNITKTAEGKRGPIGPDSPDTYDVVPGPYPDWHYPALALRKLLETVRDQQAEIEDLKRRTEPLKRSA